MQQLFLSFEWVFPSAKGYLSRHRLSDTYKCFLREFQNIFYNVTENALEETELFPQLEHILVDYFSTEHEQTSKNEEKVYALWKQLDIVVSQLRVITLGANKAKAFLRTRKNKNGISIGDFQELNKKTSKPLTVNKNIQTEPTLDMITLYTNHEVETSEPLVFQEAYFTPHKEDPALQQDALLLNHPVEDKTPAKIRLQEDITITKSPKRKATHPKRRSNPIDNLIRKGHETPLKIVDEPASSNLEAPCVSPLLEKEDFTQMLKAMFSNSNFQEKIADNINKAALVDFTIQEGEKKDSSLNVEKVVRKTTDELDLTELYTMLGDLNHYNDDIKRQKFFPTDNPLEVVKNTDVPGVTLPQNTDFSIISTSNEMMVTSNFIHKEDELNTSQSENILRKRSESLVTSSQPSHKQTSDVIIKQQHQQQQSISSELMETAEQILEDNAKPNKQQQQQQQQQQKSHVRNLNTDLALPSEVSGDKKPTNNTHTAPVMFESQQSYHNFERSPDCVNLNTPTKVTFIKDPASALPIETTQKNEDQAPLQEIENIATDALLLLSTSPAKPPPTPQKEKFSFVKMLAEPLKLNETMFAAASNNDTVQPNTNASQKKVSKSSTEFLKPFFERPHQNVNVVSELAKILPKTVSATTVSPQVLRPVVMNTVATIPMNVVATKDHSLYNQLSLRNADKKCRQNERQRRSREKKYKEKGKVVTRFLSFTKEPEVAVTTPTLQATVISDIRSVTPFLNFQENPLSPRMGLVFPPQELVHGDVDTTGMPAAVSTINNLKMLNHTPQSTIVSVANNLQQQQQQPCENLIPVKSFPNTNDVPLSNSCTTNSECSKIETHFLKNQFILPRKEFNTSERSANKLSQDVHPPTIAHKTLHTLPDISQQDSNRCSSNSSCAPSVFDGPESKSASWKLSYEKGRNKKLMKVKFNFKSPMKKHELKTSTDLLTISEHVTKSPNKLKVDLKSLVKKCEVKISSDSLSSTAFLLASEHRQIKSPKKLNVDLKSPLKKREVKVQPDTSGSNSRPIAEHKLKLPNKVKFDLKSPTRKKHDVVKVSSEPPIIENKKLKSPTFELKTPMKKPNELTTPKSSMKKNCSEKKNKQKDTTPYDLVSVPRLNTEFSFSLMQEDITTDATEMFKDLVKRMANDESIDILTTGKIAPVDSTGEIGPTDSQTCAVVTSKSQILTEHLEFPNTDRTNLGDFPADSLIMPARTNLGDLPAESLITLAVGRKRKISEDKPEKDSKKRKKKHRSTSDKLKAVNVQELLSKIHTHHDVVT